MATTITLEGAARTEFGKGAARRMRVANLIPATVYAGGEDPVFVQLPMKETTLSLRHTNALFTIKYGDETKMAVVKDVQRNPVKRIVEHVDFYEVKAGEKIDVEVPVFVEGTPKGPSSPLRFRKTLLRRRLLRLLTPLPLRLLTLSESVAQADLIPICLPYR